MVNIARILRVNRFLRDIYCQWAWPKNGTRKLCLDGTHAQFCIDNPVKLRIIEAPLEKGMGEQHVLRRLFQSMNEGDVFYDIGASLGTHTILMAKRMGENGRVIAFEPEAESYKALEANIRLNGLKNVMPIQVALGEDFGEKPLYSYGGGFGAFNLLGYGNNSLKGKIKIVPGDFVVQSRNLPLPNLVKIDVEGYEYYTILGLRNTLTQDMCRLVCCEIHPRMLPNRLTQDDVIELLRDCGFIHVEGQQRGETIHVFSYRDQLKT